MNIDEALHIVNDYKLKYKDFNTVGIDIGYYEYYYAESELYIIRDRVCRTIQFVKANSPRKAFYKYLRDREPLWYDKDEVTQEQYIATLITYYEAYGFTKEEIKEWRDENE